MSKLSMDKNIDNGRCSFVSCDFCVTYAITVTVNKISQKKSYSQKKILLNVNLKNAVKQKRCTRATIKIEGLAFI